MYFLFLSSGLKARSNVISYVTVNDSPDSDSSLSSPYSTDTLSALRGNSGPLLEGPGRVVGDGTGTRTIIVPPLKTQLGDCTVATQASGLLSSKTKPVASVSGQSSGCCITPTGYRAQRGGTSAAQPLNLSQVSARGCCLLFGPSLLVTLWRTLLLARLLNKAR